MNTATPVTGTITIEMDNPSVFRTVKTLLRQIKGVSTVKVTQKPRVKMTEEEFYAKIDAARQNAESGNVFAQRDGECINDFINRMLCTE